MLKLLTLQGNPDTRSLRSLLRDDIAPMKTPLSTLHLRRATSLAEALTILRDEPRTPVAGATDVYVQLNFGTHPATRFLDIWACDELRSISVRDDTLVLGALATYTAMLASHAVAARLPMMREAARQVGGPQIQNRGTVGGNIANGSPAGDSLPVLAAADAVVVLRSHADERRIPLTAFYTGYRTTVMRSDELIVAVEVPRVTGRQFFRKVGTRAAQAISKIVVAAVRDGSSARIAVGSVAPTVVRLRETERALAASASLDDAMAALRAEIRPIDDIRSTAEYRLKVTENVVRRFWLASI
ncbi:MAG: molybdopterin dehydrogenase FAD-binding protein [Gemmatimonadetes bacterium]|nr:molybdopterin dehydrogenase FAD-binding protein [Gemmatimonadota bacterium]